ncbi:MAG: 50S ribosomal protein L31 [Lachnospirales bacterium]
MKTDIQPKYYEATITCACGNEFVAGSTEESIKVEVCSKCHPFYTGSQKLLLEAGGRVDKFNKKYNRDK